MNKGQSLFEVVFALGVAAMVLLAVVLVSTRSVKTSDYAAREAEATKYAQEAMEWLRAEKNRHPWNSFYTAATGTDACIGTLGDITTADYPSADCSVDHNNDFERRISFTGNPPNNDKVIAKVDVTWTDSTGDHLVTTTTYFTNWRR